MRKRYAILIPATICLMFVLLSSPSPIHAYNDGPQLYNAHANPFRVNTGAQPVGHPLILSVEVPRPGGEISSVRVDLDRLAGAKFYDPLTDKIKDADVDTPMHRVYKIDGKEAYLVGKKGTSANIYREYRKTLSHEGIKSDKTPNATDKWQVELPYVGNIECSTRLRVIATNTFNEEGYAFIPLKVVDDSGSPELSLKVKYPTKGSVARPGDKVIIKAKATDDSSSVFSVRLGGKSARAIFGKNPNLALTKGSAPDVWTVENTVAPDTEEGIYTVQVAAIDRAGNESTQAIDIEVKRNISSMQLELQKGWNLMGCASQTLEPKVPLRFYFGDELKGKWRVVYTENWESARYKSTSPYVWATDDFPTITGEPYSKNPSENLPAIEIGKGYWVYFNEGERWFHNGH